MVMTHCDLRLNVISGWEFILFSTEVHWIRAALRMRESKEGERERDIYIYHISSSRDKRQTAQGKNPKMKPQR